MFRLVTAAALLALVVSGCSSSDADEVVSNATTTVTSAPATAADQPEVSDAPEVPTDDLIIGIGLWFDDPLNPLPPEDLLCIGDGAVATFGVDRLTDIGVTAATANQLDPTLLPGMTELERDQLAEVAGSCLDLVALLSATAGDGDPAITACALETFTQQDAQAILRANMNTDVDAGFEEAVALFGVVDECFALAGTDVTPPATGDGNADSDALIDALATSLDDGTGLPSAEENLCAAEALVTAFGVDRFAEVGLTAMTAEQFDVSSSEMTSDERDTYMVALDSCIDFRQFFLDVFASSTEGFGFDAACLEPTWTDDDALRYFRGFLAPVDSPDFETPIDVQAKLDACPA